MVDNNINNINDQEEISVLLSKYALGELSEKEMREVDRLIETDQSLLAELNEFESAVAGLTTLIEPLEPSAAATSTLLQRVEADLQANASPEAAKIPAATSLPSQKKSIFTQVWESLAAILQTPAFSAASIAAVVAISLVSLLLFSQNRRLQSSLAAASDELASTQYLLSEANSSYEILDQQNQTAIEENVSLSNENRFLKSTLVDINLSQEELKMELLDVLAQNDLLRDQVTDQQRVLDLFDSTGIQTNVLNGTDIKPDAQAQIAFDPENSIAILMVDGLPELQEGEVYQVLLIRGEEHDTADTFEVDFQGQEILIVQSPSPLSIFDTIGVSIEPEGGSVQRTGDIVLLGEIDA